MPDQEKENLKKTLEPVPESEKNAVKGDTDKDLSIHGTSVELTEAKKKLEKIEIKENDEKKEIKSYINKIIEKINNAENISAKDKLLIKNEFSGIQKAIEENESSKEKTLKKIESRIKTLSFSIENKELKEIFTNAQKEWNDFFGKNSIEKKDGEKKSLEKIQGIALLQAIGSPKLVRLFQHEAIDKNAILNGLKEGESESIRKENIEHIKVNLKGIIKEELSKWMVSQLPTLKEKKEKKAKKEYEKEMGERGSIQNTIEKGKDFFQGFFGKKAIDSFEEGSILGIIFSTEEAVALSKKLTESDDDFAFNVNGEIELKTGKITIDNLINQKLDEIVHDKININALKKTAGRLSPDTNHLDDVEAVLKKMRTVPEEYANTLWEEKYHDYVKEKGIYAIDFNEWISSQNVPVFEKLKLFFKKIWGTVKGIFSFGKDNEEKREKSEIIKSLETIKEEAGKEKLPENKKDDYKTLQESIINEYEKERGKTTPLLQIKDLKNYIENLPATETNFKNLQTIQSLFANEKGKDTPIGLALQRNLTVESLLTLASSPNFKTKNKKLYYTNESGEEKEIAWTDDKIKSLQQEKEARQENILDLEHTQTDLKIKLDGTSYKFGEVLSELKNIKTGNASEAESSLSENDLSQDKKILLGLLRTSPVLRSFIKNINNAELKDDIDDAGELSLTILKKIAKLNSIKINLNKDPEIKINPDIEKTLWVFGGSGDLKVNINGSQEVDFDDWGQMEKILDNPESYKNKK